MSTTSGFASRYARAEAWPPKPTMPRCSGWLSGKTPLPCAVQTTGQCRASASSRRSAAAARAPLPATMRGRRATQSARATDSQAPRPGATGGGGQDGRRDAGAAVELPMSMGTEMNTGPGRGPIAVRSARAATAVAEAALSRRTLQRVTVRSIATMSMAFVDASWKPPRDVAVVDTSPPMMMSGISSASAAAMAVMAFVIPGPLVVRTSPGDPVATA